MAKSGNTKAARVLRRVRKDLKAKNGERQKMTRGNATVVLAQGALATPKKNFGTRKGARHSIPALLKCLDARVPRTLGLPRAVGPYAVIRTTRLHRSSANFLLFAPFWDETTQRWFDWCGVESVVSSSDITSSPNTMPINMPLLGLAEACEIVPAAMTVQVMNPASLQDGAGVFAMARVNQSLPLGTSPPGLTFDEMAARVVSFYSPRLLTGGKLALRGVKCSSYPLDMTEYAKFAPVQKYSGVFQWSDTHSPAALAPIVFVQNNTEAKTLEFMVTIEWRVRFDPGNPATASHTYHDTLPDEMWNGVVKAASALGHGVEELSEEVASAGEAIF